MTYPALAVQADKPFRGLDRFGTAFLSKFQSSEVPAPILEDITFIDTPGILSGEKQRIGRSYDFIKVRTCTSVCPRAMHGSLTRQGEHAQAPKPLARAGPRGGGGGLIRSSNGLPSGAT